MTGYVMLSQKNGEGVCEWPNFGELWLGHTAPGSLAWGCFVVPCVLEQCLFWAKVFFSFSLTLVPLHKVLTNTLVGWGSLAWMAIAFSALYQGDGGVPPFHQHLVSHWGTHPMSVLLILLHSPCRLHLHFRTKRQMVAGQLIMLWCFGARYGQKGGLPHCLLPLGPQESDQVLVF